jgi:ATP-dependent Clp protease ATP-binding subunit ClpA
VARAVADQIGAPLESVLYRDDERKDKVVAELKKRLVGQSVGIELVGRAVAQAFSPLRDHTRPLASLVFAGPSGVGKTLAAQVIGESLYANSPLIRINMSEYSEPHSMSRLFGSPPGYVGHGSPNELLDKVSTNPNSVLLLDNIDKAHPNVLAALMEALESGVLTDGDGNAASFKSTFVIMTTVAGSEAAKRRSLGFAEDTKDVLNQKVVEDVTAAFGEEFAGRVDAIVPFFALGKEELEMVAKSVLGEAVAKMALAGVEIKVDDSVVGYLSKKAKNAREVRSIYKNIVVPILGCFRGSGKLIVENEEVKVEPV